MSSSRKDKQVSSRRDGYRFANEDTERDFDERWSQRNELAMRPVLFSDFNDEIREMFEFQGMIGYMTMTDMTYLVPMQLFYAHIKRVGDKRNTLAITSFVDGVKIKINENVLMTLIGGHKACEYAVRGNKFDKFVVSLPPMYKKSETEILEKMFDTDNIGSSDCKVVSGLNTTAKTLEKMIRVNMVAKAGDISALTDQVKIILYCLIFRVPIWLSRHVIENMLDICKVEKKLMGFGQVITRIMVHCNVPLISFSSHTELPMTKGIVQTKTPKRPRQEGHEAEKQTHQEQEGGVGSSGPPGTGSTTNGQWDLLIENQRMIMETQTTMMEMHRSFSARVDSRFDAYDQQMGVLSSQLQLRMDLQDRKTTFLGKMVKKIAGSVKPSKGFSRLFSTSHSRPEDYPPPQQDDDEEEEEDNDW